MEDTTYFLDEADYLEVLATLGSAWGWGSPALLTTAMRLADAAAFSIWS